MGNKIHYCLNEPMTREILPSRSVGLLWPQAVCPPGASFKDSTRATRGLWPLLLLYIHSIHTPIGNAYTSGWIRFSQPPFSSWTYSKLSTIQRVSPTKRDKTEPRVPVGTQPWSVSVERPARLFVSAAEYSHRFTNPPLYLPSRLEALRPGAWKVDHRAPSGSFKYHSVEGREPKACSERGTEQVSGLCWAFATFHRRTTRGKMQRPRQ